MALTYIEYVNQFTTSSLPNLLCSKIEPYTEISGEEFNEMYDGIGFYKFLNNDLIHNNFHYRLGLNIDTEPFNPTGMCQKGGLYFCKGSECYLYWKNYGTLLAIVEIPDDARVYIERNKFKTDKLIIKDIRDFDNVDDRFWIDFIIKEDCRALEYVKYQTEKLCIQVVQKNGLILQYVNKQTEAICIHAVKQNGLALRLVNEQTDKICVQAVKQDSMALEYVINQTEEVCRLAIQQHCDAIMYVNDPSILAALAKETNNDIKQDGYTLSIKSEQMEALCRRVVQENRRLIQHICYCVYDTSTIS